MFKVGCHTTVRVSSLILSCQVRVSRHKLHNVHKQRASGRRTVVGPGAAVSNRRCERRCRRRHDLRYTDARWRGRRATALKCARRPAQHPSCQWDAGAAAVAQPALRRPETKVKKPGPRWKTNRQAGVVTGTPLTCTVQPAQSGVGAGRLRPHSPELEGARVLAVAMPARKVVLKPGETKLCDHPDAYFDLHVAFCAGYPRLVS